jgi:Asp/Glu/hydantoin racemase
MKNKRLGLIHTSASLVPMFARLCAEKLPRVDVFNIADDSLIQEVIAHGEVTPSVFRRVASHISAAEAAGADFVLVTCSSIGPAVELAAKLVSIPVLRVDEPMADRAVRLGRRIGVAATLATTLAPTADLIGRRAAAAGRPIQIVPRLCAGAFEALMGGDPVKHDAAVAAALQELAEAVDVIVLAQASMARVAEGLDTNAGPVPILASPSIAMEHLATIL